MTLTIGKKILIVNFNIQKENFSLGALLILKQEIDLLLEVKDIKKIKIFCQKEMLDSHKSMFNQIFPENIEYNISDITSEESISWPIKPLEYKNEDSYQSFERILYLSKTFEKRPYLKWEKRLINKAKDFLSKLSGRGKG